VALTIPVTELPAAAATRFIRQAGFVESFNISVAAALILYEAQQQRLRRLGSSGDLSDAQQQRLLAEFLLRSVVSAGGVGGGQQCGYGVLS
jgi:tRNA (guanosine-2'-O-)-methyltransferase